MLNALTREPGPEIALCEITHIERSPIDVQKMKVQHADYRKALEKAGARVIHLPELSGHPDAVFVEDTAIVLPELAIMTTMGVASRRGEVESITKELEKLGKEKVCLHSPAMLEGGDVMLIGKMLYVGLSTRSNHEAVLQLQILLQPYGYSVKGVTVRGCLHLKTGCTFVGHNTILVNPQWVDAGVFDGFNVIPVHPKEPFGANSLRIGDVVLYSASCPQTADLLRSKGFSVVVLDISELEKAEAGLTCMSLVFEA